MSSVSPANALSARVMLATGIHAQPGVYALLLGSGVSRSAGISTGWEIVRHLVQKVAAADDPADTDSHALAESDPEAWWHQHGNGDLGYSSLLAAVAPSSAARQGLLAEYFIATDEDRETGLKVPTAGHQAVAELVKTGHIKVIVTTNFDRLMEQALDAVGVAYQVISRPDAATAATPLAHAKATVIKLHGDWTDLEFRNTIEELDTYPETWQTLLTQVFNEYGLLICGWSADWDRALVKSLESTPRRYPLYWHSRATKGEAARNLLAQHGGHIVESETSDALFADLLSSVEALQRLAEPPLTTAMAVARLKRALPDPLRRIELHDLLMSHVDAVSQFLINIPENDNSIAALDQALLDLDEASKPLLTLLIHTVRYDDGTHTRLLTDVLQRLLDARRKLISLTAFDNLQHYPALLALRAMSIEAVRVGRDDLFVALLDRPRWTDAFSRTRASTAAQVLHLLRIVDDGNANSLPRWTGGKWIYPTSHLLRASLQDFFSDHGVDAAAYDDLCSDVEYRTGLVQHLIDDQPLEYRPNAGEFVIRDRRTHAEQRLREHLARNGAVAWASLFKEGDLESHLASYGEVLKHYRTF